MASSTLTIDGAAKPYGAQLAWPGVATLVNHRRPRRRSAAPRTGLPSPHRVRNISATSTWGAMAATMQSVTFS